GGQGQGEGECHGRDEVRAKTCKRLHVRLPGKVDEVGKDSKTKLSRARRLDVVRAAGVYSGPVAFGSPSRARNKPITRRVQN
ncbi:MAG TPA: hypothetical protein VIT66_10335, partial [Lysobacter sp.]